MEKFDNCQYMEYCNFNIYVFLFFNSNITEINRTSIDLFEGESESVSGFNLEYFRVEYALIFIADYGIIIYSSCITLFLFTDFIYYNIFMILLCSIIITVINLRGVLSRISYDELIYVCWKIILPLMLRYIFILFDVKYFIEVAYLFL
jgi:NADH-quinone oxidoreductase subunit H